MAHALFEVKADLVGTAANSALGDFELAGHVSVVLDLLASLVEVILENQVALASGQTGETVSKAVMLFVGFGFGIDSLIDRTRCDFLSSVTLTNDVPRNSMKVTRRLSSVSRHDIRQTHHHAVDRFIRQVFSIAEAFRHKDPHQTRADRFVLPAGQIAIVTEPG